MKIFKENPNATIPEFQTEGSACFDLHACLDNNTRVNSWNPHNRDVAMPIKPTNNGPSIQIHPQFRVLVPTGLIFNIPKGYRMDVYIRSSLAAKFGLMLANGVGKIDYDYVEPLYVMLYNTGDTPITIYHNDRIAQAELNKVVEYKLEETSKKPSRKTDRDGGIGSTGK